MSEQVNIEQIMEEIRQEIREKNSLEEINGEEQPNEEQCSKNQISIEQIMQELWQQIQEKGVSLNIPEFSGVWESRIPVSEDKPVARSEFDQNVLTMQCNARIECYAPIVGNPIFRFIKRFVRKMINFIIAPIVEDQNAFNASAAATVSSLQSYIDDLEKRIGELEALSNRGAGR